MDTLSFIKKHGIITVLRGLDETLLLKTAHALYAGGVRLIEAAFDQSGGIDCTVSTIKLLTREFGDSLLVGAGTVMTGAQLVFAREAGAKYIISPNTDADIVRCTKAAGLVSIPGALTPNEVVRAHSLGADIVKIFPAGQFGPGYFAALKAPLSHIPLAAVGGVTPDNLPAFKKAGAVAFGISTGIVKPEYIQNKDFDAVTRLASRFVSAFEEG